MKVLSLFNGYNGGQISLEGAGIKHDGYYSSEIDKYANTVANAFYPDTIQLGDINNWQNWDIDWGDIGYIMGGSPCQGFSFAGKQLAFDDPRSKLFFVFMDIVKFVQSFNPDVKVLLENVKMKKISQQVITDMIGVEPVLIDSALVSAQSRKRLYWANWEFGQPEDRGIMLKDILEDGCNQIGASRGRYLVDGKRQDGKMKTAGLTTQRLELRKDNKSNCITSVQKDNYVVQTAEEYFKNEIIKGGHLKWWEKNKEFQISKKYSALNPDKAITMTARQYASWNGNFVTVKPDRFATIGKGGQGERVYSMYGKSPAQSALGGGWGAKTGLVLDAELLVRKLTVREACRLQTIPEHLIDIMLSCGVSNSQLYKMIGNGWNIDTIVGILEASKCQ